MVRKLREVGLIAVAILILSMPMAFADVSKSEHQTKKDMIFQALNLNDQQKKQMEDVRNKERDAIKPILGEIRTNQDALKQELTNANSDMNKINSIQAQIKTLQGQLEDSHLNSLFEIKKILTPEQFTKFLNMRMERKEKNLEKMQAKK